MTTEREKIKTKVVALLEKTIERGCSRAEAFTASKKAAQLMEQFMIEADELKIKDTRSIQKNLKFRSYNRRKLGLSCIWSIARLCDCKTWTNSAGNEGFTLFGHPEDLEVAEYLFEIISQALENDLKAFQKSPDFELATGERFFDGWDEKYVYDREHPKTVSASFITGMEDELVNKLDNLVGEKERNIASHEEKTGTALVVLKKEQIESDFLETGVSLHTISYSRSRDSCTGTAAGRKAGEAVSLSRGVTESGERRLLA